MGLSFKKILLEWHRDVDRDLPWKRTKDPFYIWISEIILQQTRVRQGLPYYEKFVRRFSTVEELAACSDEELMKMWQGLGYYSRARNMHKAAKQITINGGDFPSSYHEILALPGVGPYTAAAIASFAFDLPTPVLDGNVYRVISRIFGITEPIDSKDGKEEVVAALNGVFDTENPAAFNQAIMDFGAMVCTPRSPKCTLCPFAEMCYALQNEMVSELPLKAKKVKQINRTIRYAIVNLQNQLLIKKRNKKDIWRHLHDFVELDLDDPDFKKHFASIQGNEYQVDGPFKHILSHQKLQVFFHLIDAQDLELQNASPYFLVERKNLQKFAFPKIIDWYLDKNSIY